MGTSNEVSFSVLDAARQEADGDRQSLSDHGLGRISLFSLPGKKKHHSTPTKDEGLILESGEFRPASGQSSAEADLLASAAQGSQSTGLAVRIESSDMLSASPQRAEKASKGAKAGKASKASKPSKGAKPSQAKYADNAQFNGEVSRRKTRRRRGRVLAVVAGVAACIALVCVGGYAVSRSISASNEQSGTIQGALQSVIKADKVVMEVDALLSTPITEDSLASIDSVIADIPAAKKQLQSAQTVATSVANDAQSYTEKEAANNTISAVSARLEMLESGQKLLEEAKYALEAMSYVEEVWTTVLEADTQARLAIDMVSKSTDSATISAAREKAASALVAMRSSLTLIYDAQKLFSDADFTAAMAYLEKRIESLEHAVNAIGALINEDADTASSENEAYNTTDAEAAELAESLPADLSKIVYDAYCTAAQPYIDAYEAARTQAGISDQPLRTYLSEG